MNVKKANANLLKKLNSLVKKSYAPYSRFHVVALFEKKDGTSFDGINIENAAYPNSMCAERVAIYSALNNKVKLNNINVVHIYSPDSNDFLSPCGGCRQTMSEHLNNDVEIRMYNKKGEFISNKFSEIFPLKVDGDNIKGEN